jgi:hypothetical protein
MKFEINIKNGNGQLSEYELRHRYGWSKLRANG